MLSIILTAIFLAIIIFRHRRGKTITAFLLGWMMVPPYVKLGSIAFDSTYIVVIVAIVMVMLKSRRIKLPPPMCAKYLKMVFTVNILYVLSWIVFSRIDSGSMISLFVGSMKIILILLGCWALDYDKAGMNVRVEIKNLIFALTVINCIAIIYEMKDFSGSVNLLSQIMSDDQILYLKATVQFGDYGRYYGVFSYPMQMGMFALYSFAYIVLEGKDIKFARRLIFAVLIVFVGLCSATKSFIVGMLAFILLYIIDTFLGKKSKRRVLSGAIALTFLLIGIILFSQISYIIQTNLGKDIAHYFNLLAKLDTIFDTRFSSDTGVLATSDLFDVIKTHLLFGVGPSSIKDEPVMDNAVLIIMHNGGLVALCICLLFYVKLFWLSRKDSGKIIIMILILITGMGFQTWVAAPISTWLIYWLTCERGYVAVTANNAMRNLSVSQA